MRVPSTLSVVFPGAGRMRETMAPHAQLAARTSPDNHGPRVLPTRTPEVHTCSHFTVKKRFPDRAGHGTVAHWQSMAPFPASTCPCPNPSTRETSLAKKKHQEGRSRVQWESEGPTADLEDGPCREHLLLKEERSGLSHSSYRTMRLTEGGQMWGRGSGPLLPCSLCICVVTEPSRDSGSESAP